MAADQCYSKALNVSATNGCYSARNQIKTSSVQHFMTICASSGEFKYSL